MRHHAPSRRWQFEGPLPSLIETFFDRRRSLSLENAGLVDAVAFEEYKSNRCGIVGAGYRPVQACRRVSRDGMVRALPQMR